MNEDPTTWLWRKFVETGDETYCFIADEIVRLRHRTKEPEITCDLVECGSKLYARGLCSKHYQAARARGEFGKTCTELWCEGGVVARGLCSHHYYIDRKTEKE